MNRAIYYSSFRKTDTNKEILAEFNLLKKGGCLPKDAIILYTLQNPYREVTEVIFKAKVIRNIVDKQELYQWKQGDLPEVVGVDEKIY